MRRGDPVMLAGRVVSVLGIVVGCTALAVSHAVAMPQDAYREELLDNGLRVILIRHRANPMVAASVIVGAGVIHEPEGMNGISHFLEHLLFNGTTSRTQRQLYEEVDGYGAYNNATTREDHTLFTLLIQREFAGAGLEIQADMLFHSTLPPDKFEKEKGIVLEELARDKDDPRYAVGQAFRSFAYAGTPLARPILGTQDSIGSMQREEVLTYYKARYVPGNMTLVVMGDFETAAMLRAVGDTFGKAPRGADPPAAAGTWPPRPRENLKTQTLNAGRTYLEAAAPLGWSPYDPRLTAAELWVKALAEGADSPLAQVLQSGSDPLVLSYTLTVVPRASGWSTLEFRAVLPPGDRVGSVLDGLTEGLQSLGLAGAVRDRLANVRRATRAEEILLADQIHYYTMMRSAYIAGSPRGYLASRADRLEAVGEQELGRAAELLRGAPAALRVLVAGPDVHDGAVSWEPKAPSDARRRERRDVVAKTLPTGMEVVLERNDDSRVFAVHLMFRPRSASEPRGKEGVAALLHRMFLRGTLNRDRSALAARLDELGARIKAHDDPRIPYDDYYTTPEFSFVRLEMPVDDWREGIALLAEMVRQPRLDEPGLKAARRELLDLQQRRGESVRSVALELIARTLAPGHPLSRPVLGSPASVRSISLEDLQHFHKRYVSGRRMVLSEVGPVDPQEVLRVIQQAFEGLPAGDEVRAVPPPPPTRAGQVAMQELGKEQAYIGLAYLFEAGPQDLSALRVVGALLSDRLAFELRERQGLAYSLGASVESYGGRLRFQVLMGTRQDNVDRALEGLRRGIAEFRVTEPDPAAVQRAANALRGRLLMRRLTRINQAYFAGLERLERRAPRSDLLALDALLEVRATQVLRVIRRYMDPDRCATVIVR